MKFRIMFLTFIFCTNLYAIDKDLICKYLSDDLLTERDIYDASHLLMIPLEYAFQENDEQLL